MAPGIDKKYRAQIDAAREELENHAKSNKSNARDLLRLAYASQFTIANRDEAKSTTPTDGTKQSATPTDGAKQSTTPTDGAKQSTTPTDGAKQSTTPTDGTKPPAKNNHLKIIETIHKDSRITYPDLYQLAGVVAVKALGGPDIVFIPGREDSTILPDESCLPDLKLRPEELKKFFDKVKISEPKHIVALYGGLKLATPKDESAKDTPKDESAKDESADLKFDNQCFSGVDKEFGDDEFRNHVQCYQYRNDKFIKEYKDAHKKLSEFGLAQQEATLKNVITSPVGVVVAAAVAIFCVFYLINKRRTQHRSQQFQ